MIVPRSKLIFWVAAIVLPFALLAAVVPATTLVALLFIVGFILIAIADIFGAQKNLRGLSAELPAVTRWSKNRAAKLEIRIRNATQHAKTIRLGLAWPREIKTDGEEMETILPAQSEWSRLSWPCTPLKRGNFKLDSVFVEGSSPLGFWSARKKIPVAGELRVYPDLLSERKNLSALFLNRGAFGLHAQRQVGQGRDFEKLREYVAGDSYEEIHWKATARRGKPITKVFQIEKTQEVYVIEDASRVSARAAVQSSKLKVQGSKPPDVSQPGTLNAEPETVLERFVTAALVLGLAAEKQGDFFGLLTFTDKVETFVRAKNGQAHYNACRDALYTLQPKIVTPDFDELATFLRLRLRRRALLIFLTSLDDPALAESFVRNLGLLRRQHLMIVNMIQPGGVAPVFSDANVLSVDDLYRQLGGHLQWQKLRELQKIMQRHGAQFTLLDNERLSAELIAQYLSVKQRQLL